MSAERLHLVSQALCKRPPIVMDKRCVLCDAPISGKIVCHGCTHLWVVPVIYRNSILIHPLKNAPLNEIHPEMRKYMARAIMLSMTTRMIPSYAYSHLGRPTRAVELDKAA